VTAAHHTEHAERDEQAGHRPESPRPRPNRLSWLTAAALAFIAAFLIGIVQGAVEYAHRSAVPEPHGAGTNAIAIEVLVAIAAAATVLVIEVGRSRRAGGRGPSPWLAPFSASAAARLGRTLRFAQGLSAVNVARFLVTVPLVLALAYAPWRLGAQIIGGLDPNATVNAWGGPTYAGALLAHWLDVIVGFYAAGLLLSRLLLPSSANAEKDQHQPE
jgi:hypothetical protein